MKITYILSTLKSSGPVNQLFNVINPIVKSNNKIEFSIVTLSKEPENNTRIKEFRDIGVDVHCLDLGRIKGIFGLKSALLTHLATLSPDIVHSQGIRADILISSILKRNKGFEWVATAHNFPQEDYLPKYGPIIGRLMVKLHVGALRRCGNLISCSKSLCDKWKTLSIESYAIQNGVMVPEVKPAFTKEKIEKFVSVGSLIPRKNMGYIASVFCGFDKSLNLTILGDGPDRLELEKIASKCTNIDILGHVSDVHNHLSSCSAFISSSSSEGLPNTVLEALSLGIVCYLSDIESHREINSSYPNSTFIFSLNDKGKSLRRLIEEHAGNLTKERYDEAINVTDEFFSDIAMSKQYENYYIFLGRDNG